MLAVKGALFEIEISSRLKSLPQCVVLSNFRIYSPFLGKTTEIDRLLITPWAAYSIEAKSYTSLLEGNVSDQMWVGRSMSTPLRIYSPMLQNFEHIRSLNSALVSRSFPRMKFENVIVVPDSCNLRTNYKQAYNISNFVDRVISDSCSDHKYPYKVLLSGLRSIMEG